MNKYIGVYNRNTLMLIYIIENNTVMKSYIKKNDRYYQFPSIHTVIDEIINLKNEISGRRIEVLNETDVFLALL